MFYQNLKNIKDVDTLLSEKQIIDLDEYLSLMSPGSIISVEAAAFNTDIPRSTIENILISFSDYQILDTLFILKCDNEHFDFVHSYSFSTFEELVQFVKSNEAICMECGSKLLESNTEVFFLIPMSNIKKVF